MIEDDKVRFCTRLESPFPVIDTEVPSWVELGVFDRFAERTARKIRKVADAGDRTARE